VLFAQALASDRDPLFSASHEAGIISCTTTPGLFSFFFFFFFVALDLTSGPHTGWAGALSA
jgi:hypothetical protein